MSVWIARLRVHVFFSFFQIAVVDQVFCEQYFYALFTDPQITLFNNFFIKNESYNTIYTFKNYFFQFQYLLMMKFHPEVDVKMSVNLDVY